jgi:MoxR-like ATPase
MQHLTIKPGETLSLPTASGAPEQVHVFSDNEIVAINTALAARRALLVRGEPGTGKTQLALAAAVALKRGFVSRTADSRTESRDLLWHFDAVARLADAQVNGALHPDARCAADGLGSVRERLAIEKYIHPGPLWWAFDWPGAEAQARRAGGATPGLLDGCDPGNGVVVLIDEIDKAEPDVPNGLLEALGAGEFKPQGMTAAVKAGAVPPLVMVTTNEERTLPDAFIRRCLVLHLSLPDGRDDLVALLVDRGAKHFPDVEVDILKHAANLLCSDREKAQREHLLPYPGQAEFMDLVRAVQSLAPRNVESQKAQLDRIAGFALRKNPGA